MISQSSISPDDNMEFFMTFEDKILLNYSKMSKSYIKIADFLTSSIVDAAFMNAGELAQALNIDPATIVRFSKSLGYSGYPPLQKEIQFIVRNNCIPFRRKGDIEQDFIGEIQNTITKFNQDLQLIIYGSQFVSLLNLTEKILNANSVKIINDRITTSPALYLQLILENRGYSINVETCNKIDPDRFTDPVPDGELIIIIENIQPARTEDPFIGKSVVKFTSSDFIPHYLFYEPEDHIRFDFQNKMIMMINFNVFLLGKLLERNNSIHAQTDQVI